MDARPTRDDRSTLEAPISLVWCPPSFLLWVSDETLCVLASEGADTAFKSSVSLSLPTIRRILVKRGVVSAEAVVEEAAHDQHRSKWFLALACRSDVTSALQRIRDIRGITARHQDNAGCCREHRLYRTDDEAEATFRQPVRLSELLKLVSVGVQQGASRKRLRDTTSDGWKTIDAGNDGFVLVAPHGLVPQ